MGPGVASTRLFALKWPSAGRSRTCHAVAAAIWSLYVSNGDLVIHRLDIEKESDQIDAERRGVTGWRNDRPLRRRQSYSDSKSSA